MHERSGTQESATSGALLVGDGLSVAKMPAHWLMARLGKRVLRPGGVETTQWLLESACVAPADDVIEFAPGLGHTARALLGRRPASYLGVEREPGAADFSERILRNAGFTTACVLQGEASRVPRGDGSASLIVGEAMLSMQPPERKRAIIREAHRLLRPDGRYAIHELAVTPDTMDREQIAEIQKDLSRTIHVGVRIGTVSEWKTWLGEEGFVPEAITTAPMRLLELDRLVHDEGIGGAVRFIFNILRTPGAPRRLRRLRSVFRKHAAHLCAIAIVARRSGTMAAAT